MDRTPRSETTKSKTARVQTWKPPSTLDAPPAREGYAHRWVRVEANGFDDRKNLSARLREGFELVRAEEYPDWDLPTIQDGKHAGVIAVGGLVLARNQVAAVNNDLMREQHPSMPISKPERQSRVTFGGPKASE